MMTRRHFGTLPLAGAGLASRRSPARAETFEVTLTEAEWRARLSPEAYAVLREEDTERPFTSPLDAGKARGCFCLCGLRTAAFPVLHQI